MLILLYRMSKSYPWRSWDREFTDCLSAAFYEKAWARWTSWGKKLSVWKISVQSGMYGTLFCNCIARQSYDYLYRELKVGGVPCVSGVLTGG